MDSAGTLAPTKTPRAVAIPYQGQFFNQLIIGSRAIQVVDTVCIFKQ
ncbi:hypothetical protein NHJ13734_000821 [Beauveria thailandica]